MACYYYNIFMENELTFDKDIVKILLLSDTHIYHRSHHLPGYVMDAFRDIMPDLILHCGDICTMQVLGELKEIAPVYAVRGNRDILNHFRLPAMIDLTVNGARIHLEHGQGGFFSYLAVKLLFTLQIMVKRQPDYNKAVKIKKYISRYDLYCVGHSHSRLLEKRASAILINPGHLNFEEPEKEHETPSFALIEMDKTEIRITLFSIESGRITGNTYNFHAS